MKLSMYETHKRIIECCQKGHKTIEEVYMYVNRGVRGGNRWSVPAVSARRRDPIIPDLIHTDYFEGDKRGHYIAKGGALAKLNRRYKVKRVA